MWTFLFFFLFSSMSDVDKQFGSKEMFGQAEPRGWKWFEWLGWNKTGGQRVLAGTQHVLLCSSLECEGRSGCPERLDMVLERSQQNIKDGLQCRQGRPEWARALGVEPWLGLAGGAEGVDWEDQGDS